MTDIATGSKEALTLTITTISGKSITVEAPGTIAQVKQRIQAQIHVPTKFQQLIRNGDVLDDHRTVLPGWTELNLIIQAGSEFEVNFLL